MPVDPNTDERVTLVGLFLEAHRGLLRAFEPIHRDADVTGVEFSALLRVHRSPRTQLRMSDLAAQVGLSTSGVTTLVERLLARGLMERTPDPCDRRALVVTLSDAGRELLTAQLSALLPVVDQCLVEPLGSDAAAFAEALKRVRDVVSPEATAGAQRTEHR